LRKQASRSRVCFLTAMLRRSGDRSGSAFLRTNLLHNRSRQKTRSAELFEGLTESGHRAWLSGTISSHIGSPTNRRTTNCDIRVTFGDDPAVSLEYCKRITYSPAHPARRSSARRCNRSHSRGRVPKFRPVADTDLPIGRPGAPPDFWRSDRYYNGPQYGIRPPECKAPLLRRLVLRNPRREIRPPGQYRRAV
jgi:hypothetical protein